MRCIFCCLLCLLLFAGFGFKKDNADPVEFVSSSFAYARQQIKLLLKEAGKDPLRFPRTTGTGGQLVSTSMYDWTPGFFPGCLWYVYDNTGDEQLKAAAIQWTEKLEPLKNFTQHHDLGFMMYCSYGNAYRSTGNKKYADILVQAARSLSTRYSPVTKSIKSWNSFTSWQDGKTKYKYPVIIDNLMNLEMLYFAAKQTGDTSFTHIANNHALTAMQNQIRSDYSSYHVVCYDSATGKVIAKETAQGYSDNSTWARGQAWGIYGFTMCYRETKDPRFLKTALGMADWYINHLPKDLVPLWDFNVGQKGYTPGIASHARQNAGRFKDVSAAAIVAAALMELSTYAPDKAGRQYKKTGIRIIESLSKHYKVPAGTNSGFIFSHNVGSVPHQFEIDAPLIYADYYFLEALSRYRQSLSVKSASHTKQTATSYSKIWGQQGELWDKSRIPDFTHAGYKSGNTAIPDYPVSIDVTTLGARGDGITDNTAFFRAAIRQCGANGTVYIPAGKYLLSDTLIIQKSGINIQGAGNATILYFTKGLEELYPMYNRPGLPGQSDWSWQGGMITFSGYISDFGIQSLRIEFPDHIWTGHDFHERGYNAIGFTGNAHDGWIRNITISGSDVGIWIGRHVHHITLDGWTLDCGPDRAAGPKGIGHHGANVYGGHNLLQNFDIRGKFHHDLSVESEYSQFNVFRKGKGVDICIDHHNHDAGYNLFTNLDMGIGSRPYFSGGKMGPWGVSITETYWNITARKDLPYNHVGRNTSGPKSKNNVAVGIKTSEVSALPDADDNWYETIDPHLLSPPDLYEAQMRLVKGKPVQHSQ